MSDTTEAVDVSAFPHIVGQIDLGPDDRAKKLGKLLSKKDEDEEDDDEKDKTVEQIQNILDPVSGLRDLLEADEPKHPLNVPFKGASGRWFVERKGEDGRIHTVPTSHHGNGQREEKVPPGIKEGGVFKDASGSWYRNVKGAAQPIMGHEIGRDEARAEAMRHGRAKMAKMAKKNPPQKIVAELKQLTPAEQKAAEQYALAVTTDLKQDVEARRYVSDWNMFRDGLLGAYTGTHRWSKQLQRDRGLSRDHADRVAGSLATIDYTLGSGIFAATAADAASRGGLKAVPGAVLKQPALYVPWATAAYLALRGIKNPLLVAKSAGKVIRRYIGGEVKHRNLGSRLMGTHRAQSLAAPKGEVGRPKTGLVVGQEFADPNGRKYKVLEIKVDGRHRVAKAQDAEGNVVYVDRYKRKRTNYHPPTNQFRYPPARNPPISERPLPRSARRSNESVEGELSGLLEKQSVYELQNLLEEVSAEDTDMLIDALGDNDDDWFAALVLSAYGMLGDADMEQAVDVADQAYEQVPSPLTEALLPPADEAAVLLEELLFEAS